MAIIITAVVVGGGVYLYTTKIEGKIPFSDITTKNKVKIKKVIDKQATQTAKIGTVNRLCSLEVKVGDFVSVYSSNNEKYYMTGYSYAVYDTDGNYFINPVPDNPNTYYNSSGDLVGSCGGLLNYQSSLFCNEILPLLSFDTEDICR